MTIEAEFDGICGIIMPVSAIGERYTAAHWASMLEILSRAISKADMTPQPVWTGHKWDMIQGRILQNIYENEVVVCDVSGQNPNVMLELGMRLTTRKPTILVADSADGLPFDTNDIEHTIYDVSRDYLAIDKFVEILAQRITEVRAASVAGQYKPFVSNFRFETVIPSTVSVTPFDALIDKIENLGNRIDKLDRRNASSNFQKLFRGRAPDEAITIGDGSKEALQWRISTDPGSGNKIMSEVRGLHELGIGMIGLGLFDSAGQNDDLALTIEVDHKYISPVIEIVEEILGRLTRRYARWGGAFSV